MRERLTASQVVGIHARLQEHLREPETVRHLTAILPEHMRAGRPFSEQPFFPAATAGDAVDLMRADLAAARTYQISGDIVASVTSAWNESAGDYVWLREDDLPHPVGFAWLDAPVSMRAGDVLVRRAMSWAPQDCSAAAGAAARGVRVIAWHHTGDLDGAWSQDDVREWLRDHNGIHRLRMDAAEFAAFGQPVVGDGPAAWLRALWSALAEGIPAITSPGIREETRKKYARAAAGPPEVIVVSLRQTTPGPDDGPSRDDRDAAPRSAASVGPAALNWPQGRLEPRRRDYRSDVDSHHRHAEPYVVPAHRPSPDRDDGDPACTVCGKRLTPVSAHTRGPKDKPLRPRKSRLYRA